MINKHFFIEERQKKLYVCITFFYFIVYDENHRGDKVNCLFFLFIGVS